MTTQTDKDSLWLRGDTDLITINDSKYVFSDTITL